MTEYPRALRNYSRTYGGLVSYAADALFYNNSVSQDPVPLEFRTERAASTADFFEFLLRLDHFVHASALVATQFYDGDTGEGGFYLPFAVHVDMIDECVDAVRDIVFDYFENFKY